MKGRERDVVCSENKQDGERGGWIGRQIDIARWVHR